MPFLDQGIADPVEKIGSGIGDLLERGAALLLQKETLGADGLKMFQPSQQMEAGSIQEPREAAP